MAVVDAVSTGKNIKAMRVQSGMKIKDIQDICGVTATSVCNWQNGKAIPTIDNLVILCEVWHVTIDDIIVVKHAAQSL